MERPESDRAAPVGPKPGELGNLGVYSTGNECRAHVSFDGAVVTIHGFRDSIYATGSATGNATSSATGNDKDTEGAVGADYHDSTTIVRWSDETFDPAELTNMWVYFSYFGSFDGVAHTEVGFEFSDGRCAIGSFEVRTLEGEKYGIVKGFGRNFEMAMRWASERDILTRRFRWWADGSVRTYMFEGDITHRAMVRLFEAFLHRTNELYDEPEWYNTVKNSCTTSMIGVVNTALPGQLKRTPLMLLPGMLPRRWAKQGVIKFEGDFDQAFEAALINDRALAIGDVDDFTARLHRR